MVVLTSFTQPTDGIRHRQNNTTVYVNDNNIGKGTLFIAESCLSWVSDSGNGFSLEYPHISLHAISRDLSAFPQECLFLMLDTALGDEGTNNGNGENDNGNESDSDEETTELRLVPDDRGMLDAMFHAMNVCQALHPDPEDSFSDEDFYEDADDEIPMEETDYRMAGLRIENTDGSSCIGRGVATDMEEDRVLGIPDMAAAGGDRVLGIPDMAAAGGGRVLGIPDMAAAGGDRAAAGGDSQVEVPWESGRMAWGNQGQAPGERGRVAGAGGSQVEVPWESGRMAWGNQGQAPGERGRVAGAGGSQVEALWPSGTVAWGSQELAPGERGRAGDRAGDRAADTLDMVGGGVVDMVEGRAVGTLDTVGVAESMSRRFSSGSIWHQGRSVVLRPAYSPHTAPQQDHNFDDAEN